MAPKFAQKMQKAKAVTKAKAGAKAKSTAKAAAKAAAKADAPMPAASAAPSEAATPPVTLVPVKQEPDAQTSGEEVSKADQSGFLVMAKRSKDPNVQEALKAYQTMDRFDKNKAAPWTKHIQKFLKHTIWK